MSHYQGFWGAVATRAIFDPTLSDRSVRILAALATFADKNRVCDPRQADLAVEFGVTRQAIAKQIHELVVRGYVKVERGGFPARNVYRLILDQPDMPVATSRVATGRADATSRVATKATSEVAQDATSEVASVPIETEFKTEKNAERPNQPTWSEVNEWRRSRAAHDWMARHGYDPSTYASSTVLRAYREWREEADRAQ